MPHNLPTRASQFSAGHPMCSGPRIRQVQPSSYPWAVLESTLWLHRYGRVDNAKMLVHYGFVPQSNRWDLHPVPLRAPVLPHHCHHCHHCLGVHASCCATE